VISRISDTEKNKIAMESVSNKLLGKNGCLLLQPAYSKPDMYIGYLTRYAAGRRENGGVYSHASTWGIWAFAQLNQNERAFEVYKKMNPIYAGKKPEAYVAEPYVLPGNVDGPDSPNYGMAGWTWYTGSASWYQKVIIEWILGIRATEEGLLIEPHIPSTWKLYRIKRVYRGTEFNIVIENPDGLSDGQIELIVNGKKIESNLLKENIKKKVNVTATIIKNK
jgi:cellobiose phosphorylase